MVTCGASGGVLLSFLCLLNPGDEILLPDPYFMMYRHLAILCGASPRHYVLYPDFKLPLDEMASLVSEKTRVILVNSPSNPTGAVYSEEELKAVAALADRVGAVLVSDEVYDEFVYDEPFVSAGKYTDRVVVLGGFSKTLGIPGWRLGYALGPEEILEAMCTLQQFTFVCAPAPLQKAVLDTWGLDISTHIEAYRAKRDRVVKGLRNEFRLIPPRGSFYAFPSFPEAVNPEETLARCIERKLLLVPGSAFSARKTHFRISFAASDEELERGLEILNGLIH
jgi:aspartate aminotransferase/aminotransferase